MAQFKKAQDVVCCLWCPPWRHPVTKEEIPGPVYTEVCRVRDVTEDGKGLFLFGYPLGSYDSSYFKSIEDYQTYIHNAIIKKNTCPEVTFTPGVPEEKKIEQ